MLGIDQQMTLGNFLYNSKEIMDDKDWVNWSLESFFENWFIYSSPHMPIGSNECFLPLSINNSIPPFVEVFEIQILQSTKEKKLVTQSWGTSPFHTKYACVQNRAREEHVHLNSHNRDKWLITHPPSTLVVVSKNMSTSH